MSVTTSFDDALLDDALSSSATEFENPYSSLVAEKDILLADTSQVLSILTNIQGGIDMITNASDARFGLLGARFVGEETLNRFYILHCIAIPLGAALLLAIHFWRIRKDGGISSPM